MLRLIRVVVEGMEEKGNFEIFLMVMVIERGNLWDIEDGRYILYLLIFRRFKVFVYSCFVSSC